MDAKELKKLQEQLKKDQDQLKKDQDQLKKDQDQLKNSQDLVKKDQATLTEEGLALAAKVKKADDDEAILATKGNVLDAEKEQLAVDFSALTVERQALEVEKERLGPLSAVESEGVTDFNAKWLEGRIFRGRKEKKPLEKAGKKTKTRVFEAFERPMTEGDVLSFRITGTEVIIVTADGQKVKVKK